MKKTLALMAVVGSVLTGLPHVNALPIITGGLVLEGDSVTLDEPLLIDATKVISFNDVEANSASDGVFAAAGENFAPVSISGFDFTNFSEVTPFWTLSYGGDTFSFSLTSIEVKQHSATFLDIIGTGKITSNNYEASNGTFTFSVSDATGTGASGLFKFGFTASASPTSSVPDGGLTAGLLSLGFLGLVAIKRRKSK